MTYPIDKYDVQKSFQKEFSALSNEKPTKNRTKKLSYVNGWLICLVVIFNGKFFRILDIKLLKQLVHVRKIVA